MKIPYPKLSIGMLETYPSEAPSVQENAWIVKWVGIQVIAAAVIFFVGVGVNSEAIQAAFAAV